MAYFPNGSSGVILDNQCSECVLGKFACPVFAVQINYNYQQLKSGNEKLQEAISMLINENGICQMKNVIDKANGAVHKADSIPLTVIPEWSKK